MVTGPRRTLAPLPWLRAMGVSLALLGGTGGAGCVDPGSADDDDTDAVDDDDSTGSDDDGPFTLVVIPDIQYVTLAYPEILEAMTAWIVDVQASRDVRFVLQEGDLTHDNSDDEWANASAGFAILDGEVPYALCLGNHDLDGDAHDGFDAVFGVSRFDGEPWFGGTMDAATMANAWFTFRAGGRDWLVLSLIHDPDEAVLAWAGAIADDHADHRAIVLTHAYLGPSGARTAVGERIWEGLVRARPSMTWVLNGHYIDGEAARQLAEGDAGNTVAELFFNAQDRPFGGAGLLRTMTIDPAAGTVAVETYSPWLDFAEDGDEHAFVLELADVYPDP